MDPLAHWHIEAENGPLSMECADRGIISFASLMEWVEQLPYARNTDRANYNLVFDEECGACSTKNALIKAVALENDFKNVNLYVGIYFMSEQTNPGVSEVLDYTNLPSIPEAHVYLKVNDEIRDVTGLPPGQESFEKSLQQEIEITPNQIGSFKQELHQKFIANYAKQTEFTAEQLWEIRELCISALA